MISERRDVSEKDILCANLLSNTYINGACFRCLEVNLVLFVNTFVSLLNGATFVRNIHLWDEQQQLASMKNALNLVFFIIALEYVLFLASMQT